METTREVENDSWSIVCQITFSEMPGVIALKRSRSAEPQEDVFISMPEKRVATLRDIEDHLDQLHRSTKKKDLSKRLLESSFVDVTSNS